MVFVVVGNYEFVKDILNNIKNGMVIVFLLFRPQRYNNLYRLQVNGNIPERIS